MCVGSELRAEPVAEACTPCARYQGTLWERGLVGVVVSLVSKPPENQDGGEHGGYKSDHSDRTLAENYVQRLFGKGHHAGSSTQTGHLRNIDSVVPIVLGPVAIHETTGRINDSTVILESGC